MGYQLILMLLKNYSVKNTHWPPSYPLLMSKKKITSTQLRKNLSPSSHNMKMSLGKLSDLPKMTTTVNLNTLSNTLSKPLKVQLTINNTDHTTIITVIKL